MRRKVPWMGFVCWISLLPPVCSCLHGCGAVVGHRITHFFRCFALYFLSTYVYSEDLWAGLATVIA